MQPDTQRQTVVKIDVVVGQHQNLESFVENKHTPDNYKRLLRWKIKKRLQNNVTNLCSVRTVCATLFRGLPAHLCFINGGKGAGAMPSAKLMRACCSFVCRAEEDDLIGTTNCLPTKDDIRRKMNLIELLLQRK